MTGPHESTHPQALDAGAYVLGALGEADRLAFEGHLATCDECRAAVEEVRGVPALLGLVPPDVAAAMTAGRTAADDEHLPGRRPAEPVPTSVLGALMSAVRAQEVRERGRRWAAALTAAAVLVLGVVVVQQVGVPWQDDAPAPAGQQLDLVAVDGLDVPVTASVVLTAVDWGTRIDVTCAYRDQAGGAPGPGYGPGGPYSLVVRDAGGRSEEVATWQGAHGGGTITVPGATGTALEQIVEVELRDAAGTALLSART